MLVRFQDFNEHVFENSSRQHITAGILVFPKQSGLNVNGLFHPFPV